MKHYTLTHQDYADLFYLSSPEEIREIFEEPRTIHPRSIRRLYARWKFPSQAEFRRAVMDTVEALDCSEEDKKIMLQEVIEKLKKERVSKVWDSIFAWELKWG